MSGDVAELERTVHDLAAEWKQTTLGGSLTKLEGGGTPPRNVEEYWNGDIPWASVKDVVRGEGFAPEETITPAGLANSTSKLIPAGTNIFAARMGVGAVVRYPFRVAINQDLMALTPSPELDACYLFYWLQARKDAFVGVATGTTVKGIRKDVLMSFPIHLPPLDEQRRIAEVLRSVDEVLEVTRSVLGPLEAVKKGVLHETLARDPLPEGWRMIALGELGEKTKHAIVDGPFGSNLKSEHYRSSGIPVFQSGFVTSSQFRPTKYVYVDEVLFKQQIRSRAVGGDILMAKIGAQAGRCAIIPNDHIEGIIAGNCLKITVDATQISNHFLHTLLTYRYGMTGLREIITETAQPAISLARLRKLLVPVPPLEEQATIMETVHALDVSRDIEAKKLAQLMGMKSALASDLLSGRVRVPA